MTRKTAKALVITLFTLYCVAMFCATVKSFAQAQYLAAMFFGGLCAFAVWQTGLAWRDL